MRSNKLRCPRVLAGVCEDMAVFLLKTNLTVKNTEPRVENFHNERRNDLLLTKLWLLNERIKRHVCKYTNKENKSMDHKARKTEEDNYR